MNKGLFAVLSIAIAAFFIISGIDAYAWCPNPPKMGGYRPRPKPPDPETPPEQAPPAETPKEAPKETPKEAPKETPKEEPAQKSEPEKTSEPEQKEEPKKTDATVPAESPKEPPATTAPPIDIPGGPAQGPAIPGPATGGEPGISPDPQRPSGGTIDRRRPTSGGASVTRPSMDFGLQPRIQAMTLGTSNFLGLVEPWEVWWTRNRVKYLKFREPIEFIKKTDDGYINVAKEYNDIFDLFNKALRNDNDLYVRVAAAQGLSKLGDNKVNAILKKAFYSENQLYVENNIIFAMGLMGDAVNAGILTEIAANPQETEVNRAYAILALGYVRDNPNAVKTLMQLAEQSDKPEAVASAVLSLGNLQEVSAVPLLAKIIQSGVLYQGQKYAKQIRAYAALGLGRIGSKEAVNELKKSLDEKEKDVKECVAIALGLTKLPEAINPLSRMLSDRDLAVKGFASISLSQIPDKAVYPLLLNAYQNAKDPQLDGMVVLAMGLSGDKRAIPELQKIIAIKSKRPLLKGAAAIALGLLKDTSAVQSIMDLLDKTTDPVLSAHLIMSLGMIGDNKAVDLIRKKWDDVGVKTTNAAYTNMAVALAMLGARDEVVLPVLKKHMGRKEVAALRQHAIHSAGLIGGKELIGDMVGLYDGETNSKVREYILNSLGFIVDVKETPLLAKVTADNNHNIFMWIMEHLLPLPLW